MHNRTVTCTDTSPSRGPPLSMTSYRSYRRRVALPPVAIAGYRSSYLGCGVCSGDSSLSLYIRVHARTAAATAARRYVIQPPSATRHQSLLASCQHTCPSTLTQPALYTITLDSVNQVQKGTSSLYTPIYICSTLPGDSSHTKAARPKNRPIIATICR